MYSGQSAGKKGGGVDSLNTNRGPGGLYRAKTGKGYAVEEATQNGPGFCRAKGGEEKGGKKRE